MALGYKFIISFLNFLLSYGNVYIKRRKYEEKITIFATHGGLSQKVNGYYRFDWVGISRFFH
jgi:hypothetical protein